MKTLTKEFGGLQVTVDALGNGVIDSAASAEGWIHGASPSYEASVNAASEGLETAEDNLAALYQDLLDWEGDQ